MNTVIIDNKTIEYMSRDDIYNLPDSERQDYDELYTYAELIAKELDIPCPDINILKRLVFPDENGGINEVGGKLYTPEEVPNLDNNLILLSDNVPSDGVFYGTLAHEMRHIWQNKYPDIYPAKHANGFYESLDDPKEIDADGYAIAFLCRFPNISLELAAEIMCSEEKRNFPEAYEKRIFRANEIMLEIINYQNIK